MAAKPADPKSNDKPTDPPDFPGKPNDPVTLLIYTTSNFIHAGVMLREHADRTIQAWIELRRKAFERNDSGGRKSLPDYQKYRHDLLKLSWKTNTGKEIPYLCVMWCTITGFQIVNYDAKSDPKTQYMRTADAAEKMARIVEDEAKKGEEWKGGE